MSAHQDKIETLEAILLLANQQLLNLCWPCSMEAFDVSLLDLGPTFDVVELLIFLCLLERSSSKVSLPGTLQKSVLRFLATLAGMGGGKA